MLFAAIVVIVVMYLLTATLTAMYNNVDVGRSLDTAWAMGVFWPIFVVRALYRGFMKAWKS